MENLSGVKSKAEENNVDVQEFQMETPAGDDETICSRDEKYRKTQDSLKEIPAGDSDAQKCLIGTSAKGEVKFEPGEKDGDVLIKDGECIEILKGLWKGFGEVYVNEYRMRNE